MDYVTRSATNKKTQKLAEEYLSVDEIERYATDWIFDADFRGHSKRTLEAKQLLVKQLMWWLRREGIETVGTMELRRFLAYVRSGYEEPDGRWGNPRNKKPMRPGSLLKYWSILHTLFAWFDKEGLIAGNPVSRIEKTNARPEEIRPFTDGELRALLLAARRGPDPKRDEALVLFLLDTGLRASEVCALRWRDVDMEERSCVVVGKGNKRRTVYFGRDAWRLLVHLRREQFPHVDMVDLNEFLWLADRGPNHGRPLTRSGLGHLIARLSKRAGIKAARCSPHTFRHTFAISFLRDGGDVFTLQRLLGHSSLLITQRYVSLAQADLQAQHRKHSPGDRLRANSGNGG